MNAHADSLFDEKLPALNMAVMIVNFTHNIAGNQGSYAQD